MAAVICAEDSLPSFSIWSGLGHWGVSSHEKGERGRRKAEGGGGGGGVVRMREEEEEGWSLISILKERCCQ